MTITVHVPDFLLEDLGESPEELRREIFVSPPSISTAAAWFRRGEAPRSPV